MTRTGWLLAALAASLAVLAYTRKKEIMDMLTPRGIRNNNPGNIRHSVNAWQGMSSKQTDPDFVQFIAPEYGIRALAKLLTNYYTRDGLNTVRKIISKYAPSSENNTEAYAQAVSRALGVTPDTIISVPQHLTALVEAIIKHENGQQPYKIAQISTGVSMA
jgi:hypothetical protein